MAVEESFQPKTLPEEEVKRKTGESSENSSSSASERWVIKFEQSINIFLTVYPSLSYYVSI